MRGSDRQQGAMFSYVSLEKRVPADHPLRAIREMTDEALKALSPRFSRMYSQIGRPSIPPEQILRSLVLQVLYTIRSERMLIEQLDYNLLFRWFVGLGMDDEVWVPTVFTKNRDRLLAGDVAQAFFDRVLSQAREKHLLSNEHFTVDGTLIEAWASHKSYRPKDGGDDDGGENFHGQTRSRDTHESTTDPDALLYRKGRGKEAKLSYMGHVLMENRNGLVVASEVTQATGKAEREAALRMIRRAKLKPGSTVGADKGYDQSDFVDGLRSRGVTPHVAQFDTNRRSKIDERTTRHAGYAISQIRRKVVEQVFGWGKSVGGMRKTKHRGRERVGWGFVFTNAVYNLVRMRPLIYAT
jgi:transposase